ncbi:lysozyme inhibitor [Rosenbergiella epipactidis]|uniref:MliC family protein n=1 Tax=Rosenbergiella epipactidis TaxID=1544694 RepID=UPI001BDB5E59|nr:MliC family protein [Rosenbergiella epipactidis]MBT0717203.1 lysozyme inhibitor [Rosenbergiella epipactidis]
MKCHKSLLLMFAMAITCTSHAAETFNFTCNGKEMKASFPDTDHAVMQYDGELFLLKSVVSASGARYLGDGWQLWSAKDDITLTKLTKEQTEKDDVPMGHEIECQEVDADSLTP